MSSSPDKQKKPSLGVLCASAVNKLSNNRRDAEFAENICFAQSGDGDWAKTSSLKGILEGPLGLLWTTYLTESLSNLLSSGAFYNLSPLRRKMTFEGLL